MNSETASANSSTKKVLELNGRCITLIGTAHVSAESVAETQEAINTSAPDCIAVELDSGRYESMMDTEKYKNLDIVSVLRRGEALLVLANLILGSFQKRMGKNVGVRPGDEMKAAVQLAKEKNIPFELVDRPIKVTLNRAWAKNSFWGKCKLLSALLSSAFSKEEISSEEIEALKKENEMDSMMKDLADFLPTVKEVLIDERDRYLAAHIWNCKAAGRGSETTADDNATAPDNPTATDAAPPAPEAKNITAILGAGHLPGVQAHLEKIAAGEEDTDTTEISAVPPKSLASKMLGWAIPALIVAIIAYGFYLGGRKTGGTMLGAWFVLNGVPAALGTLIAAGHPLAILSALVGAPITSLCPFIGVGFVAGLIQAAVKKPLVRDMETLADDATTIKGFYANRITRVLLVFFLSSIGSSIGTFVAGATLIKTIINHITNLF